MSVYRVSLRNSCCSKFYLLNVPNREKVKKKSFDRSQQMFFVFLKVIGVNFFYIDKDS